MSDKSTIQWTDATWNPTTGCTKVSPGCANCYIERTPAFRIAGRKFIKGATDLRLHADRLEQPLHWRKPRRVFVNSLSDLFHPDVPDEFIDRVFAVMALADRHTFQVLTKRPERMRCWMARHEQRHPNQVNVVLPDPIRPAPAIVVIERARKWPLPNVWLGVSVENQAHLYRIDKLKDAPAAVHFVSFEPLLEDLGAVILDGIEWGIIGFESGANARSGNIAWAQSLLREHQRQGVPAFVKQLGDRPVMDRAVWRAMNPKPLLSARNHRKVAPDVVPLCFYAKKAGDPAEWPADLQVREFPGVRA